MPREKELVVPFKNSIIHCVCVSHNIKQYKSLNLLIKYIITVFSDTLKKIICLKIHIEENLEERNVYGRRNHEIK